MTALVEEILRTGDDVNRRLAVQPSVVLWASITRRNAIHVAPTDIEGTRIQAEPEYVRVIHRWLREGLPSFPRVHRPDSFLRLPFGNHIIFEPLDALGDAVSLVETAFSIIRRLGFGF